MNTEYTKNEDSYGETDRVVNSLPYFSPSLESAVEVAAAAPEVAAAAAAVATTVSPGCR